MEEVGNTEASPEAEAGAASPIELTRARLAEIGEIWVEFAKQRAETYKEKAEGYRDKLLPEALKGYLMPKAAEDEEQAPAATPAQGEAA